MRLIQVLSMLLTQLSVGTLLATSLLPTREIRSSFFTFNSLLAAIFAGIALVITKKLLGAAWWDVRYLGLTIIGATAAWGCFRLEKPEFGRLLLILSGLAGLVLGVLPLAATALEARQLESTAGWLFDIGILLGTIFLGATHVGMILGHWYLLMRRLSFVYLERFSQLVLGAVLARALWLIVTLTLLPKLDPLLAANFIPPLWSPGGHLFFMVMRLLWGLALPLVLAVLVLRCVAVRHNQAATGMLYVCEISVLFGELFAGYLLL